MQVNMHEAKTRLSELVAAAERGEEVVIARNGEPAAKLVPVAKERRPFEFGRYAGRWKIHGNFEDPLPEFEPYM